MPTLRRLLEQYVTNPVLVDIFRDAARITGPRRVRAGTGMDYPFSDNVNDQHTAAVIRLIKEFNKSVPRAIAEGRIATEMDWKEHIAAFLRLPNKARPRAVGGFHSLVGNERNTFARRAAGAPHGIDNHEVHLLNHTARLHAIHMETVRKALIEYAGDDQYFEFTADQVRALNQALAALVVPDGRNIDDEIVTIVRNAIATARPRAPAGAAGAAPHDFNLLPLPAERVPPAGESAAEQAARLAQIPAQQNARRALLVHERAESAPEILRLQLIEATRAGAIPLGHLPLLHAALQEPGQSQSILGALSQGVLIPGAAAARAPAPLTLDDILHNLRSRSHAEVGDYIRENILGRVPADNLRTELENERLRQLLLNNLATEHLPELRNALKRDPAQALARMRVLMNAAPAGVGAAALPGGGNTTIPYIQQMLRNSPNLPRDIGAWFVAGADIARDDINGPLLNELEAEQQRLKLMGVPAGGAGDIVPRETAYLVKFRDALAGKTPLCPTTNVLRGMRALMGAYGAPVLEPEAVLAKLNTVRFDTDAHATEDVLKFLNLYLGNAPGWGDGGAALTAPQAELVEELKIEALRRNLALAPGAINSPAEKLQIFREQLTSDAYPALKRLFNGDVGAGIPACTTPEAVINYIIGNGENDIRTRLQHALIEPVRAGAARVIAPDVLGQMEAELKGESRLREIKKISPALEKIIRANNWDIRLLGRDVPIVPIPWVDRKNALLSAFAEAKTDLYSAADDSAEGSTAVQRRALQDFMGLAAELGHGNDAAQINAKRAKDIRAEVILEHVICPEIPADHPLFALLADRTTRDGMLAYIRACLDRGVDNPQHWKERVGVLIDPGFDYEQVYQGCRDLGILDPKVAVPGSSGTPLEISVANKIYGYNQRVKLGAKAQASNHKVLASLFIGAGLMDVAKIKVEKHLADNYRTPAKADSCIRSMQSASITKHDLTKYVEKLAVETGNDLTKLIDDIAEENNVLVSAPLAIENKLLQLFFQKVSVALNKDEIEAINLLPQAAFANLSALHAELNRIKPALGGYLCTATGDLTLQAEQAFQQFYNTPIVTGQYPADPPLPGAAAPAAPPAPIARVGGGIVGGGNAATTAEQKRNVVEQLFLHEERRIRAINGDLGLRNNAIGAWFKKNDIPCLGANNLGGDAFLGGAPVINGQVSKAIYKWFQEWPEGTVEDFVAWLKAPLAPGVAISVNKNAARGFDSGCGFHTRELDYNKLKPSDTQFEAMRRHALFLSPEDKYKKFVSGDVAVYKRLEDEVMAFDLKDEDLVKRTGHPPAVGLSTKYASQAGVNTVKRTSTKGAAIKEARLNEFVEYRKKFQAKLDGVPEENNDTKDLLLAVPFTREEVRHRMDEFKLARKFYNNNIAKLNAKIKKLEAELQATLSNRTTIETFERTIDKAQQKAETDLRTTSVIVLPHERHTYRHEVTTRHGLSPDALVAKWREDAKAYTVSNIGGNSSIDLGIGASTTFEVANVEVGKNYYVSEGDTDYTEARPDPLSYKLSILGLPDATKWGNWRQEFVDAVLDLAFRLVSVAIAAKKAASNNPGVVPEPTIITIGVAKSSPPDHVKGVKEAVEHTMRVMGVGFPVVFTGKPAKTQTYSDSKNQSLNKMLVDTLASRGMRDAVAEAEEEKAFQYPRP